jgi:outer membrane murein-binding lipoprotein Lpp
MYTTVPATCQGQVPLPGDTASYGGSHAQAMAAANPLSRVRMAAAKVHRAEQSVQKARRELRAAIASARDAGESLTAIAKTLGVTRQRVSQLLER